MTAAEVTTEVVTAVVEAQFRELAPARAAYLNEGCDSAAFVINDTWVFRFPKREDVERQLAIETRVLARLEERSPLTVPAFRFHGRPSAAFPFHFVGYARIPGVPGIQLAVDQVPFDGVAATLGRFLTWLHAMPIEPAERLGVPRCEIERFVEECGSEALADFETVARVSPSAPLEEWRAFLLARPDLASISEGPPLLLHNDLPAEHLLFDPSPDRIYGVVDWSDSSHTADALIVDGMLRW